MTTNGMPKLYSRGTFGQRKWERTKYYFKHVHGWKLQECVACMGSGYYDHNGSPPCGSCEGTGRTRYFAKHYMIT